MSNAKKSEQAGITEKDIIGAGKFLSQILDRSNPHFRVLHAALSGFLVEMTRKTAQFKFLQYSADGIPDPEVTLGGLMYEFVNGEHALTTPESRVIPVDLAIKQNRVFVVLTPRENECEGCDCGSLIPVYEVFDNLEEAEACASQVNSALDRLSDQKPTQH